MNRFWFWLLSLTWGLPLTLFGGIISLCLLLSGHRPRRYGYGYCFELGQGWGGLELGPVFLVCRDATPALRQHEYGHGFQNILYGPLMLPLVTIPSAIRYWYRAAVRRLSPERFSRLPGYYAIWFERQANQWGKRFGGN